MSETSFASLSSTLLARKGGAKPAMRPQNMLGPIDGKEAAANLEDLGWDDMGDETPDQERTTGDLIVLKGDSDAPVPLVSPVRETIERIAQKLESPGRARARPRPRTAADPSKGKRRAAFTLRLDPDRHLRLRLASTVHGKSAQVLVTEALDAMLAGMPEIDQLAAQVSRD